MLSERPDVVRWGDVPLDMTSIVGRFKRPGGATRYSPTPAGGCGWWRCCATSRSRGERAARPVVRG